MDTLTFLSEVISSLAWPSAAVLLVFLLRKPIVELVPLMKRLKYKELELEFSQQVLELKTEAESSLSKTENSYAVDTNDSDRLLDLVLYSTRAAIMEAWIKLETAAIDVASSYWGPSSKETFRSTANLGEYLLQCKVIDETQLSIYNTLRKLRNKSAHAEELHLSEVDVKAYVQMAINLSEHIRREK